MVALKDKTLTGADKNNKRKLISFVFIYCYSEKKKVLNVSSVQIELTHKHTQVNTTLLESAGFVPLGHRTASQSQRSVSELNDFSSSCCRNQAELQGLSIPPSVPPSPSCPPPSPVPPSSVPLSVSPWWRGSVPALFLIFSSLFFFLFLHLVQSFSLLLCCTLDFFDATLQSAAIGRTEHAQTLQRREERG